MLLIIHGLPWISQLVKNPPAMQETPVQFLGQEDPLEKGKATTPVFLDFPCGSIGKESAWNTGDPSSIPGSGRSLEKGWAMQFNIHGLPWWLKRICLQRGRPGLGRSPGGGHGNSLQCSCLENPHILKSLVG